MCGIVAVVGKPCEGEWKETHALLSELLVQSMERGVDATGFAAITSSLARPFNHRLITSKAPQPADEFVATNPFWQHLKRMDFGRVIPQFRRATHGSQGANNKTTRSLGGRNDMEVSLSSTMASFQSREKPLIGSH